MAEIPQSLDLLPIVRMPGVEPGSQAWEACMMPLHYMRHTSEFTMNCIRYMELGVQICKGILVECLNEHDDLASNSS